MGAWHQHTLSSGTKPLVMVDPGDVLVQSYMLTVNRFLHLVYRNVGQRVNSRIDAIIHTESPLG